MWLLLISLALTGGCRLSPSDLPRFAELAQRKTVSETVNLDSGEKKAATTDSDFRLVQFQEKEELTPGRDLDSSDRTIFDAESLPQDDRARQDESDLRQQQDDTYLVPDRTPNGDVDSEVKDSEEPSGILELQQVLESVASCYPELEIAVGEIAAAAGKTLASEGAFDQVLSAHSISQPLGFYQTYRNGVGLAQPLFTGGEVYGAYRIGDGNFEPWFGERETNEAGELKAGVSIPLVKDRSIDARRAKLAVARIQQQQVNSNVEARLLQFQFMASSAYWAWVVSGQAVDVQERLLELAESRIEGITIRIEEGDLRRIAQIDNDRFIAKRRNTIIKARRSLEKAAIKLSMFWRDADCRPVIVADELLPEAFPEASEITEAQILSDIQNAIQARPEVIELQAMRNEVCVDLQYAQNLTMPKVDFKGFAGQDLGGETSSKGDKTPFELQLGVLAEVPLQRREGLGKIQQARGKLTQIDAKLRLVTDKIRAEIQDSASAVNAAFRQIDQSTENLELTRESLELGRVEFDAGNIGLIELNIYETAAADAELEVLDAKFSYFFYRAAYIAAINESRL